MAKVAYMAASIVAIFGVILGVGSERLLRVAITSWLPEASMQLYVIGGVLFVGALSGLLAAAYKPFTPWILFVGVFSLVLGVAGVVTLLDPVWLVRATFHIDEVDLPRQIYGGLLIGASICLATFANVIRFHDSLKSV